MTTLEAGGMRDGRLLWLRRLSFAAVLAVAAIAPGPASGSRPAACAHARCEAAGTVAWTRLLPGQWIAQNGLMGTTPAQGEAFAALGGGVAVVGAGLTLDAFAGDTGRPLWTTTLTGFPPGAAIVSVRAWPGVVTAGVEAPLSAAAPNGPLREEVALRSATGRQLGRYPAAPFGGAVAVGPGTVVIVGPKAVTRYASRTGRVLWSRPTGPAPQAWQEDGGHLYVSMAAGGYLSAAPVTALRRIDLRTGAERLVRGPRGGFAGRLSLAFHGVVFFTGARGVTAYGGATGRLLWRRAHALPESVDVVTGRLYLLSGNVLAGVNPWSGQTMTRVFGAAAVASSGLYGVREGTVLGLDHGALGKAWGYDAAAGRVTWTSVPLPWPHYFVDLSGIGGSASPSQDAVLLGVCAQLGPVSPDGVQQCARPELVALNR